MASRKYIHELDQWPQFFWDQAALTEKLASVRHIQGRLIGRMEGLGFALQGEAVLQALTEEVVKTSEIEGENLNREQVRSSVARRLGLEVAGLVQVPRDVEGIVEVMLDATQNFQKPLTQDRLFGWHAALFPTGRSGMSKIIVGDWRDDSHGPMQVVSGSIGREHVHYEAPEASRLAAEMKAFLKWLNQKPDYDLVLKAAVAHFYFVTLHPFEDGNGRLARAIQGAEKNLAVVLGKARFWEKHAEEKFNDRQKKIINRLLDGFEGKLTSSKWAALGECSQDTASRDIEDLITRKILKKNPEGGRSTSYSLA
jgi:Fic family protein